MNPLRRQLLLGAAGLPLAACTTPQFVAPPQGVHAAPRLAIGDRWVFELINRYNGSVIGRQTREVLALRPLLRIGLGGDPSPAAGTEEVYQRPWQVVEEWTFGERLVFEQPLPIVPDRLAVGAEARQATRYRLDGAGEALEWSQQLLARGWERVRVPAGDFDALRIERTIWFRHHDMFRLNSWRRDWLWYAPQLDHWVRREWFGRYYLPGKRAVLMREDWVEWQLSLPPRRAA